MGSAARLNCFPEYVRNSSSPRFMPIKVKDPGTTAARWVNKASNATADYKAGVMAPKQPQNAAAIAAIPRWQQAVSSTAAAHRMASGLRAAGDAGWQAGASGKGASHYADGIRAGQAKFTNNVTPYLTAIAGVTLPDKGIRGSSANYARVQAVGDALHQLKLQRAGGG